MSFACTMHVMATRGPATYTIDAGILDELREDRALLIEAIEDLMLRGTTPQIEPLCEWCRASTVRGENHSAHCHGLRLLVLAHVRRCPTCNGLGVIPLDGDIGDGVVTLCPTCSKRVTIP